MVVLFEPRSLEDVNAFVADSLIAIRIPNKPIRIVDSHHRVLLTCKAQSPAYHSSRSVRVVRWHSGKVQMPGDYAIGEFKAWLMRRNVSNGSDSFA